MAQRWTPGCGREPAACIGLVVWASVAMAGIGAAFWGPVAAAVARAIQNAPSAR
jgi:predicted benzoate:H+ symporter BenE